jgi:hypothetical protein
VMANVEGPERDAAIHAWCSTVWQAYSGSRETVVALLRKNALIPSGPSSPLPNPTPTPACSAPPRRRRRPRTVA